MNIPDDKLPMIAYDLNVEVDFLIGVLREHCQTVVKKDFKNEAFEQFWAIYRRKGNKKQARAQWMKMTHSDMEKALAHAQRYVSSREWKFQKDAERYLKHEVYNDVIGEVQSAATSRERFIGSLEAPVYSGSRA